MRTMVLGGAVALLVTAWGSAASAQEEARTYVNERVAAPTNAFELQAGSGYTQGFGNAAPSRAIQDVSGAGMGFDIGIGYRMSPEWAFGVHGQYQQMSSSTVDNTARGLEGDVNVTYHFDPYTRLDPWLRIGTGYRALWEVNRGPVANYLHHGFDLARLNVGADLRVSDSVALGPVIGADVNVFLWEQASGGTNLPVSPQLGTFVYAGLQGTFDIGGARELTPRAVLSARR